MIHFLLQDSYCRQLDSILRSAIKCWNHNVVAFSANETVRGQFLIATPPTGRILSAQHYKDILASFKLRALWVDWGHLQYPEDLAVAFESSWDMVFSCLPETISLPVLSSKMVRLKTSPVVESLTERFRLLRWQRGGAKQFVYISQPLNDDRGIDFDQIELFEQLRVRLKEAAFWRVVTHPRESSQAWQNVTNVRLMTFDYLLRESFTGEPNIWGYNSLLLLAAKLAGFETHSARKPGWALNRYSIEDCVL